jgi:hypothetical protein
MQLAIHIEYSRKNEPIILIGTRSVVLTLIRGVAYLDPMNSIQTHQIHWILWMKQRSSASTQKNSQIIHLSLMVKSKWKNTKEKKGKKEKEKWN